MSQEKRIQDLEDAVLHLSRAINRLIEAHELDINDRSQYDGVSATRASDESINEAYKALQKAVDLMSVKEYE